jgi:hypothetical protein
MNDAEREQLRKAYRATRYVIRPHAFTGGSEWVLRVDALHPELDTALAARGHLEWAFLTAWNPGSRPRDKDENDRAQQQLKSELAAEGWLVVDAIGVAVDENWSEDSLFVPGLSRAEAERLGRAYGQVAVLVGRVGAPAELLFCEDSLRSNQ